jgi:hypothetical protein
VADNNKNQTDIERDDFMKDKKKAEIYDIVCEAVEVQLSVESDRLFNKIAHLLSIDATKYHECINESKKMKEYIKVLESNILEMQRRLEKHDNETGVRT